MTILRISLQIPKRSEAYDAVQVVRDMLSLEGALANIGICVLRLS